MRVGIIGYGLMGKRRAATLEKCGDILVGFVDPALEDGITEEVLFAREPDAVIVSTPTHLLAESVRACLRGGIEHILVEKPCAPIVSDLEKVILQADVAKACVVPGYTLRHYPGIRHIKQLIDSKCYGRPLYARILYGHGGGASGWRAKYDEGGGEMLDQGSHLIDLTQYLFGTMTLQRAWTTCQVVQDVEDNVMMWLEGISRDAVSVSLHASWTEWEPVFRLEVVCEEGMFKVEGLGNKTYGPHKLTLRSRESRNTVNDVLVYEVFDALEREWIAFKKITQEESEALLSVARDTLVIIDQAKEART